MKLNPQQAPLYGQCVLTVQLNNDDVSRAEGEEPEREEVEVEEEEVEFYLLFSGSTQRHVTSTVRVSRVTLQAVCPAHHVCEQVLVTLCWARPGAPVDSHSQETFTFVQDLALDMAHFLLDSTDPQEALLLDDEQIPLKECKRLDQSLALALEHLSLPYHTRVQTCTQRDVGIHMNHHTQTDAQTHGDINGCPSATCTDPYLEMSTWMDRRYAVCQSQNLYNLLHLAASHGLWMVASFVLQQDGSREALRRADAQGQTAADVAKSRGHKKLGKLFTRHEASEETGVKPKKELLLLPGEKVFQHHADLGTYTLTFLGRQQQEGEAEANRKKSCPLLEDVEELRRLMKSHRGTKGKSGSDANREVRSACRLQLSHNRQGCRQSAGLSLVTTTTTDEQGSPLSLENRVQREDPAVVAQTSCTSGRFSQGQETQGGPSDTQAVSRLTAQKRKNKKRNIRTTRRPPESTVSVRSLKAEIGTAGGETKTPGSGAEREGAGSWTEPAEACATMVDCEKNKTQRQRLCTKNIPCDEVEKSVDRQRVASHSISILAKQETAEWQSEVLIGERQTETVRGSSSAAQDYSAQPVDSAAQKTAMGHEQSQQSHADPALCKNTSLIQNHHLTERQVNNICHHSKDLDQGAGEESKSVWYDCDRTDVKKCDLHAHPASPLLPPQLEHGYSSCQLCTTPSQPHAAGAQPAPSHGPAAQRREVHAPQPEKEVGPDWKDGGVEESRAKLSNKGSTYSRKSSAASDTERGGEQQTEAEKVAKSRKKRRQKKGRKGGAKPRLCPSSSVELKRQSETQTEQVTSCCFLLESKAKDLGHRAYVQSVAQPEPASKEDMVKELTQLPRQTEDTGDSPEHNGDSPAFELTCACTTDQEKTDPAEVAPSQTLEGNDSAADKTIQHDLSFHHGVSDTSGLDELDTALINGEDSSTMQVIRNEAFDATELESKMAVSPVQQTLVNEESVERPNIGKALFEQTELLDLENLKDFSLDAQDTQPSCLMLFPEENTQLKLFDANIPKQTSVESETSTLSCELAEDVLHLQMENERTGSPEVGYLLHCLACDVDTDQQQEVEKRRELFLGGEEEGEDTICNRRKENNSEKFQSSSAVSRSILEDETSSNLDLEKSISYDANLVATAVAVVSVAIASAIVCMERAQESASRKESASALGVGTPQPSDSCMLPTTEETRDILSEDFHFVNETDLTEELQATEHYQTGSQTEASNLTPSEPSSLPKMLEESPVSGAHDLVVVCSPLKEDISEVDVEPAPEADETTAADVSGQRHMQTQGQASCPVTDTGQAPEDVLKERLMNVEESKGQLLGSLLEEKDLKERAGSPLEKSPDCGDKEGGYKLDCCEKTEERSETCRQTTFSACHSDCHPELHDRHSPLPETPGEGERRPSPLPVAPCDTASVVDPGPDLPVLTVPTSVESSTFETSLSKVDMVHGEAHGSVVIDEDNLAGVISDKDSVDTLDGWAGRKVEKEVVAVDGVSDTETELFPAAQEEFHQSCRDTGSPHTLQSVSSSCVGHSDGEVSMVVSTGASEEIWSLDAVTNTATDPARLSWHSETEEQEMGECDEEEEEGRDQLPDNPVHSAILRASAQSMSVARRHSWQASLNAAADDDITQCSSGNDLSEELKQTQAPLPQHSISEEDPGTLHNDSEEKGGPKIRRTFSYFRSKMSKKGKDKKKERRGEKEQERKEKDKKNPAAPSSVPDATCLSITCQHCTKPLHNKDTFHCNSCGLNIHKSCRESSSLCPKSKAKLPSQVPDVAAASSVSTRSKSTSSVASPSASSTSSSSSSWDHWSTVTSCDDQTPVMLLRRQPSFFNTHSNLSKSISTSNIAGLDDVTIIGLKFLSQSTDSLHRGNKVNASVESLPDEDSEISDNQLMEEFECDFKDLEAESWSSTVDKKFLKTLKKDDIKRQDVIYELYQTEFHHVRTLKIMSEVYYNGLLREVQLETDTLEKIFPVLDDLLSIHTEFLIHLLEAKRASSGQGQNNNIYLIRSIGDILVKQFSDCSAERMKKSYGKFCSRHHDAVNLYKDFHAKDKRFQAFIKKTMSSSIVRRLSIPECILLVTQRITKYPVLIQRILQHTKDSDTDFKGVCESLRCVKELITAVDSKVNDQEKKRRLREIYTRTDSKSIMRMKSGQMFAKEDLLRGRKLLHDGAVQLKNSAGRLKDVHAMLLSDVLVFLQEKDQKYVFASLDQRSTVISLQNLIVREVANEERGLFVITAGTDKPEMVEVLASSKEERNVWMAILQDAMHCMDKDEDDGPPSETEEDRRQQESRAKEIRELLRKKDEQIISLLEEKVVIFRELASCSVAAEDPSTSVQERMLFRATAENVTKGEPIIKDALKELERLHALVGTGAEVDCSNPFGLTGGDMGPVCLPRRAETFGGFDSHQMSGSKNGEKEDGEEQLDLRRTESDSVLKKGATANLQVLLKRTNGQVQHSVTHLYQLLISLQAVVVQQDVCVENQRQALDDWQATISSTVSSTSSLLSSSSSRSSTLTEQGKHKSLEMQRQEAASLQKQQASYQDEKKKKEKEWELKEKCLTERAKRLKEEEEETRRKHLELQEDRETLRRRKEEYERELAWLKEAQKKLERDEEALRRDAERLETMKRDKMERCPRFQRTSSINSEDSVRYHSSGSLDLDLKDTADVPKEVELSSSAPTKEPFLRIGSKRMGKNLNPFSSSSSKTQGAEKSRDSQLSTKLLQLTKSKEKKDKKKKENKATVMSDPQNDEDIFFC